jgi:hypothetical protein
VARTRAKAEAERRRRIDALKAEARGWGVYITHDNLPAITKIVNRIRKEREGKPPCYWRSYDKAARECHVCEEKHNCARGDDVPAELATDEARPVACRKCGEGQLSVELRDPASREVRDYGCSNRECLGRLSEQGRHVDGPKKRERVKVGSKKGKVKVVIKHHQGATDEELRHTLVHHVRTHPGCSTRELMAEVKGTATRKQRVLAALVAEGILNRERVGRQLQYFLHGHG